MSTDTAPTPEISYDTFNDLRDRHRLDTSWAVWANPPKSLPADSNWPKEGVGDAAFFEVSDTGDYERGLGTVLRRDVLILPLNKAERKVPDSRPFSLCHDRASKGNDHRLRAICAHYGLWGALICDLDNETKDTDGRDVVSRLKKEENASLLKKCANHLDDVLSILKLTSDARIVRLGDKCEQVAALDKFQEVLHRHCPDSTPVTIKHFSDRSLRREKRIADASAVLGDGHPGPEFVPPRDDQ